MASLKGTASELGGAIRVLVGLSRPGRLRDQIEHTLALYGKAAEHEQLKTVHGNLQTALEHQTAALKRATDPAEKRKLNWASFFVCLLFIDAPIAALGVWFYTLTDDHGAWWIATILAGVALLLCVTATFFVLLQQEDD